MSKKLRRFVFGLIVVSLAAAGPCAAQSETDRGLIGHWEFHEAAGDAVRDSSGNRNDGRIVPSKTPEQTWGKGPFARSASFSGDNDHFVQVPASDSINSLKTRITVVALIYPRTLWTPADKVRRKWDEGVTWVANRFGDTTYNKRQRVPNLTGYIAVVQRQWRETMHPDLFFLGYGPRKDGLRYKWHLGLKGSEPSIYALPKGQDKPRAGEWVQLAGVYDGDTGKMSMYVDGELIGTETHVGQMRLDPQSLTRPLAIGAELNGPRTDDPSGEFDGYVRDVRIYNRALSDDEVRALARQYLGPARK
ncbi:LamG domain-containing protein [Phenylobacterium montanum]|uniref:LamG domain-containing protein n=1 Tax=Phenylobacterium montanum TaxID=2823693 RepID=A0A975IWB3_9CAUL|nr:LamG domain-containing protein [Caulobacter sp. S6]QUD89655.1 LamG domain-containing protein [Caulobacter sp. S6]